ncbi:MAG: 1-acyl-sn-glycerol-3-phosphate acyltransferase [Myxococcota bacterium]
MEGRSITRSSSSPPARPYAPNALLRWIYGRFFRHIHVDERWSGVVRSAAERGVVVYVMRSLSLLDFLCLDYLVKRFGLPLVRFVNELGLWILEPFGKGGRSIRLRRRIPEDRALSEVVRSDFSALLFLRRPPKLGRPKRKGEELQVDLIRTLVEAQRRMDRPILLVPQTFVWRKLPPTRKRGILDFIFGPVEWPGRIRVFFQFLLNFRNALLRSGEPIDISRFVDEHQELTDAEVADKIRYALLRRMERERTLVLGPTKKSPTRIQEELLRSPRVRTHIESEARASGKPVAKVERYARRELRRLCADQNMFVVSLLHRFFDWVWHRIYDGLVVDKEGMERLREAARSGAIVLLPSHKSHVDYLVLSDTLYANALSPPLIAAGENLNFWPVGALLRRGGAFFIRRSFRGKKLYAALVDAYIRKLLVEGFPIEFFIEGGRSRTGKLLPPKYGLLSMVVDAALLLRGRRIHFVPISIGYEKIVEERSYVHELGGGEKEKESVGALIKSSEILRSRYGRLYVQFGEILTFDDVFREELGEDDGAAPDPSELTPSQRRLLVQRLAHRVVYEINSVTVVTPAALVATALLVHRRRGMTREQLVELGGRLLSALDRLGAKVVPQLRASDGGVREDTLREALQLFCADRLVVQHEPGDDPIYAVPEERRINLEYYMNNILHFFVPKALISSALLAGSGEPVTGQSLRERVRQLSRLFKYEFMFRADASFDAIFDDALGDMVEAGELERVEDHVRPSESGDTLVRMYAAMLRSYFESYMLALRGCSAVLEEKRLSRKDWLKRALVMGQRLYLAGAIELRESISKPRLENALMSLHDLKVVRLAPEQTVVPGELMTDREQLRYLEKQLQPFLR